MLIPRLCLYFFVLSNFGDFAWHVQQFSCWGNERLENVHVELSRMPRYVRKFLQLRVGVHECCIVKFSPKKSQKKFRVRRCWFWAPAAGHSGYLRRCTGASGLPLWFSCVLRPCWPLYNDFVIFEDERLLSDPARGCLCVSYMWHNPEFSPVTCQHRPGSCQT
jgi:hypothetical protein